MFCGTVMAIEIFVIIQPPFQRVWSLIMLITDGPERTEGETVGQVHFETKTATNIYSIYMPKRHSRENLMTHLL